MNTKKLIATGLGLASVSSLALAEPRVPGIGPGPANRPNPEELVIELFAEYDTNEDNLMNPTELQIALAGMHAKRMAQMAEMRQKRGMGGQPPRRGPGLGRRQPPDPEQVASRFLERFDSNADQSLNTEELTAALKDFQEMRRQGPRGRGPLPPLDEGDAE